MLRVINYFFQSIIIYSLFFIGKILGIKISRKLFSFLFNKIGFFFKSKSVINENLNKLIGSYNDDKKREIINDVWSNYGKIFVEYIFLNKFKKDNKHIEIRGEKYLKEIINKNKNVIFVSGHFSNFELMSMELTKRNINLATLILCIFNNFFHFFFRKLIENKKN